MVQALSDSVQCSTAGEKLKGRSEMSDKIDISSSQTLGIQEQEG